MNLKVLINRIADQADDFLEGVTSREQARAAISEVITLQQSDIAPADRNLVIDGVMAVLDEEGFFESLRGGGVAGDDESDESDDQL